jgi:hypothetical protein
MEGWTCPCKDCRIGKPIVIVAKKRNCMSGLIRILTAAMFTAHIMLGCCIHHAHACDNQGCALPIHGMAAQNNQCPDDHGSGAGHSNHGSQGCKGENCSFVHANFKAGNSLVQLSRMIVTPFFEDLSVPDMKARLQHSIAASRLLTPFDLHLANQVLLI